MKAIDNGSDTPSDVQSMAAMLAVPPPEIVMYSSLGPG